MEANTALLKRLSEYQFDDPNSTFPFSAKLAKETGWSRAFTLRAIEEYRRFCYLAATAGHPVSPSEVVDEVWHMHLIYSYEYWKVFCPTVLEMDFHHHPSKGGRAEHEKHTDWSRKTLDSYRVAFGEEPPQDIWGNAHPAPVNSTHFLISKAKVQRFLQLSGLSLALLVAVGCADSAIGNPLDFRGPEFLLFYIVTFVITFIVAQFVRRGSGKYRENDPTIGPYELAFLANGDKGAVSSALTKLATDKVIERVDNSQMVQLVNPDYLPTHELESALVSSLQRNGPLAVTSLQRIGLDATENIRQNLVSSKLIFSPQESTTRVVLGFLITLAIPAYGLLKINIGMEREKPVGFLIALTIISVIFALTLLVKPRLTRAGERKLKNERMNFRSLQYMSSQQANAAPADYAMAMALFGTAAFAGSSFSTDAAVYHPQPEPRQNYSGTSNGSSCSSGNSSCGGGGGGGSCGGGCGGCGGS